MLQRAGHVAEVRRRAEHVAVGLEHVERRRGQRRAGHHLDALDARLVAPRRRRPRTASATPATRVWWTTSNRGTAVSLSGRLEVRLGQPVPHHVVDLGLVMEVHDVIRPPSGVDRAGDPRVLDDAGQRERQRDPVPLGRSSTKLLAFLMKMPTDTGSTCTGPSDSRWREHRFEDRPFPRVPASEPATATWNGREVIVERHRGRALVGLVGPAEHPLAVRARPARHPSMIPSA